MSKKRIVPCQYYMWEGACQKGREGTYNSYCQKCKKYLPQKHRNMPTENLKKKKLEQYKREGI